MLGNHRTAYDYDARGNGQLYYRSAALSLRRLITTCTTWAIEPLSDWVSVKYLGDWVSVKYLGELEVTRVLARIAQEPSDIEPASREQQTHPAP